MISVAIDGFTGCGKSTLAQKLCEKLGFRMLDTGAIFRGIACAFGDMGYGEMTEKNIDKFVTEISVEVKFIDGVQHVIVNGDDKTPNLRTEKTSALASKISVFPKVRTFMNDVARDFAKKNDCIIEGRDIGSVVLPNANVKIFLTADEDVRAKRRYLQLVEMGKSADYEEVLKDLKERDYRDSHRDVAPLKMTSDAIKVDNTNMTFEETVDFCYDLIKQKM